LLSSRQANIAGRARRLTFDPRPSNVERCCSGREPPPRDGWEDGSMKPRFVEVSHVIEAGMVTYPGLPVPEVKVIVVHDSSKEKYQGKSEFFIASLHACGNTGTYVDSPLHRYRGGQDLADLPLDRLAHVPIRVFDATSLGRAIGPELFAEGEIRGKAVL